MLNWLARIVALGIGLSGAPAFGAEALALKVLGFSPDGRYFGFMQYGPRWEANNLYAEAVIVDASRDRLVPGAPMRMDAEMTDEATEDNVAPAMKAFVAATEMRAKALFKPQAIGKPGTPLARVAAARAGDYASGPTMPASIGETTVTVRHPKLGDTVLTLAVKEIDWPKTAKLSAHKEAEPCTTAVDWQKGAGFQLTLRRGVRTSVLNDDKTIPAARHCAMGYGIVEVIGYDRPDGKVTLAVILAIKSRGFEGEDRRFLAVTRVLDR